MDYSQTDWMTGRKASKVILIPFSHGFEMQETKGKHVLFCQKEKAKTKQHKPAKIITLKVKAKN